MKTTLFHLLVAFLLGAALTHNLWLKTGASLPVIKGFQIVSHHGPASPVVYTIYYGDKIGALVECKNKLYTAKIR